MKYIGSEKLIAEIERYENTAIDTYNPHEEDADYWHGKVVACEDLKILITSIQQEQPKVDLEREIIRYKVPFSDDKEYLNETTLDSIAKHFYELGLRRAAEMYDEIEYNRQREEE